MLEAYVDAELQNGEALAWTLDVTWGAGSWVIQYGVSSNDATGYHRILDFDEKRAETLEKFLEQLQVAVSDLIESASTIAKLS